MNIVCLDMEGVLVPEIWIAFADAAGIPDRAVDLSSVRYAVDRLEDQSVTFTDDALQMIVKVPRPFLKLVLTGCVNWAHENNVTTITAKEMQEINDKRAKEKKERK